MDFYVRPLGRCFVHRFQDAYLLRPLRPTPDGEMFLRARHDDLFFRRDLALATYRRLLDEYPGSPYVEDTIYFIGRLDQDLKQRTAAEERFDTLFARFGQKSK